MELLNNWLLYVILYLIVKTVFIQFYKMATKKIQKTGALTVLLDMIGGLTALVLCPFFEITFPTDIRIYIILGISIICYTIKDRLDTKVLSGIEASTFNILQQLSTTFMIFVGLIFFKEEFILAKFIGAMLIIVSNILVFYKKGKLEFNKYVLLGIIANLIYTVALFFVVNISEHFNLLMYASITLTIPAILIMIFERIKLSEIKNEFVNGNGKAILVTAITSPLTIITSLKAYQLGNVTIVAPLCALSVMLNVMVGYLFLKEKDNLLRKIISAILIIISIILIKI